MNKKSIKTSSTSAVTAYADVNIRVVAQGKAEEHRIRQARRQSHSEYQPTGIYVTQGDQLTVIIQGSTTNISAVIGVPELETPTTYALGSNTATITATNTGLLSFINQNTIGDVNITVRSVKNKIPTFELGITTNEQWSRQMADLSSAQIVQLTSKRAIIVVRYKSAAAYLDNPEELMKYYDDLTRHQDGISGVTENGKYDYAIDPNKLLYMEADRLYMFATNGHMGFHGEFPLQVLLGKDRSLAWGPWHECGHQRQIAPLSWSLGSGMVETAANIYSLAAQEAFDGYASRLDGYYPLVKKYLSDAIRDYNFLDDHFLKIVMLWQLRLTFGKSFYPQLHQVYRLMTNKPIANENQVQSFITETSLLTQIDLTVFFERWGLYPNRQTLMDIGHLRALELPIWDTDASLVFPITMPYPVYIPELSHLLNGVEMGDLLHFATFTILKEWYLPYRYEMSFNGVVYGSIDNGNLTNCEAIIQGDHVTVTTHMQINAGDNIEVFVIFAGKRYLAATGQPEHVRLASMLEALFTDERQIEVNPSVTQIQLNNLYSELAGYSTNEHLHRRFHRAQLLFLNSTIRLVSVLADRVDVELSNQPFRDYTYVAKHENITVSILAGGRPTAGSTLVDNVWSTKINTLTNTRVSIQVTLHLGHVYDLFSGNLEEDLIARPVRELFTDSSMTALKPHITHETIDDLRPNLSGNMGLSPSNRVNLLEQLYTAKTLLLSKVIESVAIDSGGLKVTFNSDDFKTHVYHIYKNNIYCSELTYGKSYYSSITGLVWTTSIIVRPQDRCEIVGIHNALSYVVFKETFSASLNATERSPLPAEITQCPINQFGKKPNHQMTTTE